jgi:hypothetical protein
LRRPGEEDRRRYAVEEHARAGQFGPGPVALRTPSLTALARIRRPSSPARGKLSAGERLIGPGWAVTAAGAPASIVSQADGLRDAVLETRKLPGYEHPFYRAAFTLMGDGR